MSTNSDEFLKEQPKNPGARAEFEALQKEHSAVQAGISSESESERTAPELPVYQGGRLKTALIDDLISFLLGLGKGFTYAGRQKRISAGGTAGIADIIFYHRILKCFVLVRLKSGSVQGGDTAMMNMFLRYFRDNMSSEGDTEPCGIVIGGYRSRPSVDYVTENISKELFMRRYQPHLPLCRELSEEIRRFIRSYETESKTRIRTAEEIDEHGC